MRGGLASADGPASGPIARGLKVIQVSPRRSDSSTVHEGFRPGKDRPWRPGRSGELTRPGGADYDEPGPACRRILDAHVGPRPAPAPSRPPEVVRAMTQIEEARRGVVTPEMEYVARREKLEPETRPRRGGPGPDGDPGQQGPPRARASSRWAIGIKATCKINANIGNSAVTSDIDNELAKLKMAVDLGADTVMDLSTGGNIDAIRAGDHRRQPRADRHRADVPGDPEGQEGRGPHRAGPRSTSSSTRRSRASTT